MTTITTYIKNLKEEGLNTTEIAQRLGVSQPMVSSYVKEGFNCKLSTAINIYRDYNIILHPFAEESLKYELERL